jgi:hypothetical protein
MNDPEKITISLQLKIKTLQECKRLTEEKIMVLTSALNDITEAANNDTKSSAGDKYETGRAMMQQEHEKLSKQLAELQTQKKHLEKTEAAETSHICGGSLVQTSAGIFFIATALGKIKVNGIEIFVISPLSPIGKLLTSAKNSFALNGTTYHIKAVV